MAKRRSQIKERLALRLLRLRNHPSINHPTFHGKSNSLACCAKVTTFFETALAFPRYLKFVPMVVHHYLWLPEVILVAHLRLVMIRLIRNRVRLPIPIICVKGIIPLTFVRTWMKLREFCTTLLFLHPASRLVTRRFLQVLH